MAKEPGEAPEGKKGTLGDFFFFFSVCAQPGSSPAHRGPHTPPISSPPSQTDCLQISTFSTASSFPSGLTTVTVLLWLQRAPVLCEPI